MLLNSMRTRYQNARIV